MPLGVRWFVVAAMLAVVLGGPHGLRAQEDVGPGQGALQRGQLKNFTDFEEMSLEALLGVGEHMRFSLNMFGAATTTLPLAPSPAMGAFDIGPLFFLASGDLDNGVGVLAEIGFSSAVNVHRLWLSWHKEHVRVRAGRMHTDLGYWNTAYHHGTWLQLTQLRPRFVAMDGPAYFPVHTVGVETALSTEVAQGRLSVVGSVTDGRPVEGVEFATLRPFDKALTLVAYYERKGDLRFRFGGGAFYDWVRSEGGTLRPALPGRSLRDVVGNVHAVLFTDVLTVLVESYGLWDTAATGAWQTFDAYALVGYRLEDFTPYMRVEYLKNKRGAADPLLVSGSAGSLKGPLPRSLVEPIVGVRYDLSPWSALRLEYRLTHRLDSGPDAHVVAADWSFGL